MKLNDRAFLVKNVTWEKISELSLRHKDQAGSRDVAATQEVGRLLPAAQTQVERCLVFDRECRVRRFHVIAKVTFYYAIHFQEITCFVPKRFLANANPTRQIPLSTPPAASSPPEPA
ncbi:hypothetical protein [Noviherbaspirillum sp. UKPF54]|uniref:hypothetical protein n=1 Tax=Noviherbaspirillum sp. UKPF54 TaxID=2601898 RepID=UPI00143CFB36|nr:hypothetical protein [Noviherbaspirillum sp. UKPF54]